ncbi:MAG: reverse transcriptase domain-containing protein [Sedimenticola sp.]
MSLIYNVNMLAPLPDIVSTVYNSSTVSVSQVSTCSSVSSNSYECTFSNSDAVNSNSDLLENSSETTQTSSAHDICSFPCYYTNAQSILNKVSEFSATIDSLKPYIIGITESWLKPDINDAEVKLNGYEMFRCDREATNGGGSLLYINNKFSSSPCEGMNSVGFEDSIWRTVNVNSKVNILVGVVYRSPSSSAQNDSELLRLLQQTKSCQNVSHVLIMGDFNLPQIKWQELYVDGSDNSFASKFYDVTNDLFLIQHVQENTRFRENQESSLLDLVFTNDDDLIDIVEVLPPLGKSDHVALLWSVNCSTIDLVTDDSERLAFEKADFVSMNTFLDSYDWDEDLSSDDIDICWGNFARIYECCVIEFVPIKHKQSDAKAPWFRKKVKESVRKKHYMYRKQLKSKSYVDIKEYKKQCAETDRVISEAKTSYESHIMSNFKTQPKPFYRYVKSRQKVKVNITNLEKEDGTITKDDNEVADELSDFFCSVFTQEPSDGDMPNFEYQCEDSLESFEISEECVAKKLGNLRPDKSQGLDCIHPRVLKECSRSLAKPLAAIFNKSLETGKLPNDWKSASITPIFKKGSRSSPGNYRPVSITSVPCKVLESIIRDAITAHFDSHNLISSEQHGFVKRKSCLTNLLETLDDITSALDNGEGMDMIFLDYSKAFDSVAPRRLIHKVERYGIGGNILRWIEDFLSHRKQIVTVRGSTSKQADVISGVPQGSVLGPLLFILFVNDMPEQVSATVKMFADDTKLYRQAKDYNLLQRDLENLEQWSNTWLLKFNASKCKCMHFGFGNPKQDYVLNNTTLTKVSEEKDLGVYITDSVKPSIHCIKSAHKANCALRTVKKTFSHYNKESFSHLYKAYVRRHLDYCVQAWNPYFRKYIECLEKIQKRATKFIPELRHLNYSQRLSALGLTSLEERRHRGDLIETYKILTGKENIDSTKFFTLNTDSSTRGNMMKLYKPRLCKGLLQRVNFFSIRIVNAWNQLPDSVISAETTNTFKNRLDRHLKLRHGAQGALAHFNSP